MKNLVLLSLLVSLFASDQVTATHNHIYDLSALQTVFNGPGDQSRYGKDSATCVMNISLYREFYKQWKNGNYKNKAVDDAIRPWLWVFNNCPKGTQNTYIDGVKIMEYRIKKENDRARRENLIDTLMLVYDQRIQYFGREGYVLGRKGVDMAMYRPNNHTEIYNTLKRSVELEGNNSPSAVLVYYFRAVIGMVEDGTAEKALIVETYDQISGILDYNISNNTKRSTNYENAKANIELSFSPFATCEDLVSIFMKKYEASPEDPELLKKIIKMLDDKGCTEEPLYFDATVKLYDLEPTPESAFLIGKMYYKKEDYANAAKYLEKTGQVKDENDRVDAYLLLSHTYFSLKQYSKARSAALKAAELKPSDGRAYMLIGDMYAASASECGDNKLTKKVAFWAAVDKYYKAKSVDPSLEPDANAKIGTYSKYFPPIEDIFFYELSEGESYTVGCWINEVTTVRALK